jgi:hypothetical protein
MCDETPPDEAEPPEPAFGRIVPRRARALYGFRTSAPDDFPGC